MLKLGAKSAPAPAPAETPAEAPAEETPTDDLDFGGDTATDDTATADDTTQDTGASDKPFDDEPFDAGVEADEESDPKKFIEQLTGKLGQSLRKYNEDQGEPDFELEKFAVNSLLSATHTGEMDAKDQKDIIKKVKGSGKGDGDEDTSSEDDDTSDETSETGDESTGDESTGDESNTDDSENMFENGILDEMSLSDHRAAELIDLYDNSNHNVKLAITRLVCGNDIIEKKKVAFLSKGDVLSNGAIVDSRPFGGTSLSSGKIYVNIIYPGKDSAVTAMWGKATVVGVLVADKERFLKDLNDDIDKEEIEYIFKRLKDMGIVSDSDKGFSFMKENEMILKNPPKNNMFQEGSNDILDEYEIYEVVEEGKKKKKKTKKDACYHKVRARYDVWPSAYASGALVKCRAVGAANWGNSTDESEKKNSEQILDKIKNYKLFSIKEFNKKMALEQIPEWKTEYENNIAKINEMVARHFLYDLAKDLVGGVNEIHFVNESKNPVNHFQMEMHLGDIILDTAPFIYLDNNHRVISKRTKIEVLNDDYNTIKKLMEVSEEIESLKEKWSAKYKKSIDCNNPKGFSQKAHCQGKKKHGE